MVHVQEPKGFPRSIHQQILCDKQCPLQSLQRLVSNIRKKGKHSVNYRYQTFIYNNSDCHYKPNSSSRYCFVEPICCIRNQLSDSPYCFINTLSGCFSFHLFECLRFLRMLTVLLYQSLISLMGHCRPSLPLTARVCSRWPSAE